MNIGESKVETFVRKYASGYIGCIRVRNPLAMPYTFQPASVIRLTKRDALQDAHNALIEMGWGAESHSLTDEP